MKLMKPLVRSQGPTYRKCSPVYNNGHLSDSLNPTPPSSPHPKPDQHRPLVIISQRWSLFDFRIGKVGEGIS